MKDQLKHDMHRDPAELEREADEARINMEHTLEALERRLSPGELLDQVMHVVKQNSGDFSRNLSTQVRNNPLPAVLAGIGITWLMAASNRPPPSYSAGTATGPSLGSRASSAASSASSRASSAASTARGAASQAGESARSAAQGARSALSSAAASARGAMGSTRDRMGDVAGATRHSAESVAQGFDYLRREQPLVLGVMAVAAGALIGAMFPSSRTEDEWLGEHSDDAARRIKEQARQQAEEARSVAAEAADAARSAAPPQRAGAQAGTVSSGSGPESAPI